MRFLRTKIFLQRKKSELRYYTYMYTHAYTHTHTCTHTNWVTSNLGHGKQRMSSPAVPHIQKDDHIV